MTDKFSQAAKNLSESEKKEALASLLENANETEAGIIRQILGEEKNPIQKSKNRRTQNI